MEGKFDEVFALISEAYDANIDYDNSIELTWRYARACFDQQEALSDKKAKKAIILIGLKMASEAINQDETHYAGHKWRAILLSQFGRYTRIKQKISNSFLIREELDLAYRYKPYDTTILFALGKWCQGVASVGRMQRKMAAALFAMPPVATYHEAIGFFKRAFKITPRKRFAFAIGECYCQLTETLECRKWMQKCLDCSGASNVDRELNAKARSYI